MKLYFYQHTYLRDRQIDTVKFFGKNLVENYKYFENKKGNQVTKKKSLESVFIKLINLINFLPLINFKFRPKDINNDIVVYSWGGIILTGQFIIELDNPWCMVRYNIFAMHMYKLIIKKILLSNRCIKIVCLSLACKQSFTNIFGNELLYKIELFYPKLPVLKNKILKLNKKIKVNNSCKFIFVGTQFRIKGGDYIIDAFIELHKENSKVELTLITFLNQNQFNKIKNIASIKYIESNINRDLIFNHLNNHDVLLIPSFGESFGLIALEALSKGLAIISTDVYALNEIVHDNYNGYLIKAPISKWNKYNPTIFSYSDFLFRFIINYIYFYKFKKEIFVKMKLISNNKSKLYSFKENSLKIAINKFSY